MERFLLNCIIVYLKWRGFFFRIERKRDHPIYKDNFVNYEIYEYTEGRVESFKKETLVKNPIMENKYLYNAE